MKTTYLFILTCILFYGCKREDNILFRTRVYVTAVDGNTGLPVKDAAVIINGYNELDNWNPNTPLAPENYKDQIRFEGKTDEKGEYEIKFRTKSRKKYTFYAFVGFEYPSNTAYTKVLVEPKRASYLKIGKLNNLKLTFY